MRNRLTFPTAGTETKYVWDRHNIQNNGIYKWDKHDIINETRYYWDKYSIRKEKLYNWEQYTIEDQINYNWYRYGVTTADSSFASSNFICHVKKLVTKTKYLNLSNSLTNKPTDFISATGTFVWLYTADNEAIQFQVSSLKNNVFTCNPLYYGFVGFSKSSSYDAPSWYFTKDSQMVVESGTLKFTNLYNTSQNMYIYPMGMSDSPTRSTYMTFTMPWPTDIVDISTYQKTTYSGSKYHRIVSNKFYEMLNDGFWLTNENAVGAKILDKSNMITLTSPQSNKYPTGFSGEYFYVSAGTTTKPLKGEYIQDVQSKLSDAYPQDGEQDGYWYVTKPVGTYYWEKYSDTIYGWDIYNVEPTGQIGPIEAKKAPYHTPEGKVTLTFGSHTTRPNDFKYTIEDIDKVMYSGDLYEGWRYNPDIQAFEKLPETDIFCKGSDYEQLKKDKICKVQDVSDLYITSDGSANTIFYVITSDSTVSVEPVESSGGAIFDWLYLHNVKKIKFGQGCNFISDYDIDWFKEYGFSPAYQDGDKSTTGTGTTIYSKTQGGVTYYDKEHRVAIDNPRTIRTTEPEVIELIDQNHQSYNEICENIIFDYFNYPPPYCRSVIYSSDGYRYEFVEDQAIQFIVQPTTYSYSETNIDRNKYPDDGQYQTNYWLKHIKDRYRWAKYTGLSSGTLIETVYSVDANAYPNGGVQDGYYYKLVNFEEKEPVEIGDYIETIYDLNPDAYPQNWYVDQNWYIYKENKLFQYKGIYLEEINDEIITGYPQNGVKGNYWYVYTGYEDNGPYKSRWVDEVETNQSNSYPADGIQGDYWYVYKKSYEGYKLQINDWQIKGGVNYKHNINPEKDFTIGCVSSAEIDFEYDNHRDDFDKYLDEDYCDYYTWQPEDNDWRLMGRFWITDADYTRNIVKVKAFDSILASDTFVDEFIENTTFPITLTNFFMSLCEFLGITGKIEGNITNTNISFADNFEAINITARQLFQYIAEMAGGFIKSGLDGTLILTTYSSIEKRLDNSHYTTYTRQRFDVEPISGLTVRMNADDLGVSSGDVETNPYIIENNPLFYAESTEEITPAVNMLYNAIKTKTYRPATIKLLQDFDINCGDIITVDNDTFYVMSKELDASGCKLECFGNQYREKQATTINSDIVALRGKTNELYRDLDTTRSTLTDRANGLESQITQTAEEINLRVTNEVAGLESEISQTAEQISTRVTNEVAGLESKITQTADSITSTVTDEINQAKSEIKQTTDSISLEVQNQGDLVAQLVLDVDGISAKGYVTFTDLAGSGTTTINGSNITTGTISADRINLKGAISWGDLDDDCQDTIISYGGDTLPSYIKSTYISSTEIRSPTIYGATIYAGLRDEGFCKMTSSGLNVVSDTGGNVCGIGWEPGYYNLPYVVLGQGVDDYGTDSGMIKKYTHGIWIGDSDSRGASNQQKPTSGTGIFVDFVENKIYKYINGTATEI